MIKTNHWIIEGINEWRQVSSKFKWYTYTLINIEFERDDFLYGYEFRVIFLGLGFRIRYNTTKALEQFDEWVRLDE